MKINVKTGDVTVQQAVESFDSLQVTGVRSVLRPGLAFQRLYRYTEPETLLAPTKCALQYELLIFAMPTELPPA